MNNADFEGESEDRWEVAWSEFDWERYVRQQDEAVRRYLAFYDDAKASPERIDEAARQMGWDFEPAEGSEEAFQASSEADSDEEVGAESIPYTLHKHPVYVATRALYIALQHNWERLVVDFHHLIPVPTQLGLLTSLHRGELHATMAVQSLDVGDYTLAVSQFKRALAELNESMKHVDALVPVRSRIVHSFRDDARMRLFDLREIWLRVMSDCRNEERNGFVEEDPGAS